MLYYLLFSFFLLEVQPYGVESSAKQKTTEKPRISKSPGLTVPPFMGLEIQGLGDGIDIPLNDPITHQPINQMECATGKFMENGQFHDVTLARQKFPPNEMCVFLFNFENGWNKLTGELEAYDIPAAVKNNYCCIIYHTQALCFCEGKLCNERKINLLKAIENSQSMGKNPLKPDGSEFKLDGKTALSYLDDDQEDFRNITNMLHQLVKAELLATGEITTTPIPTTLSTNLGNLNIGLGLHLHETDTDKSKSSTFPVWAIICLGIGSVLLLVGVGAAVFFLLKRKKEKQEEAQLEDGDDAPVDEKAEEGTDNPADQPIPADGQATPTESATVSATPRSDCEPAVPGATPDKSRKQGKTPEEVLEPGQSDPVTPTDATGTAGRRGDNFLTRKSSGGGAKPKKAPSKETTSKRKDRKLQQRNAKLKKRLDEKKNSQKQLKKPSKKTPKTKAASKEKPKKSAPKKRSAPKKAKPAATRRRK